MDSKARFYAATIVRTPDGCEADVSEVRLFSTRENAVLYTRARYEAEVKAATGGAGLYGADFGADGDFSVVNSDGDVVIGRISGGLEIDGAVG